MNFNYLCFWFLFLLFFIDSILISARFGFFGFVAFVAGVSLLIAWRWYAVTTKPSQPLQRIKFGNQYLLVEVA